MPRAALALIVTAGLLGCGGPPVEFAEVEGKLTINDTPVPGALVRFYPISSGKEQLPPSGAITDNSGKFVLTHEGDKPGAVVGQSKVTVNWPTRDVKVAMGGGAAVASTVIIPVKYTGVVQTPMVVTVNPAKSGTRQTINVPIKE